MNGNLLNLPHKVVIKLQDEGWILRNTIIWKKTNPKPVSSKSNLSPTYEFIFHLVKSKDYTYTQTKVPTNSKNPPPFYNAPRHRKLNTNDSTTISTTSVSVMDFLGLLWPT